MKKIITIITLIGFSQLHAQVGISTETPMATLHVKEYANAINPKTIIPIHTNNKKDYKNIFSKTVLELDDNQTYKI